MSDRVSDQSDATFALDDGPSDLLLDRYLRGELSAAEQSALASQLTRSDVQARLAERQAERDAFGLQSPSFAALKQRAGARRARWSVPRVSAVLGAAAAAVALVVVVGPALRTPPHEAGGGAFLTKGGFLSFAVSREGEVRQRTDLAPRDRVRFVVDAGRDSFVAVLSRDGAGEVSVYAPLGQEMERARGEHTFDHSTELDDVLGEELFVGVRCEQPAPLQVLRDALVADEGRGRPTLPSGCAADVLRVTKAKAP